MATRQQPLTTVTRTRNFKTGEVELKVQTGPEEKIITRDDVIKEGQRLRDQAVSNLYKDKEGE